MTWFALAILKRHNWSIPAIWTFHKLDVIIHLLLGHRSQSCILQLLIHFVHQVFNEILVVFVAKAFVEYLVSYEGFPIFCHCNSFRLNACKVMKLFTTTQTFLIKISYNLPFFVVWVLQRTMLIPIYKFAHSLESLEALGLSILSVHHNGCHLYY